MILNRWMSPARFLIVSGFLTVSLMIHGCSGAEQESAYVEQNGADIEVSLEAMPSDWRGDMSYWSFKDGVITGTTTEESVADGPTYLIWDDGSVGDFELNFDYRFVGEDGNSGVQYRSIERKNYLVHGYQADFETGTDWNGVLVEMGDRLHLALRGEKVVVQEDGKLNVVGSCGDPDELQSFVRNGDWNRFTIVAKGNHLIHRINGHVMVDAIDNQTEKAALSGILALQLNRSRPMTIQFRNLTLQQL